MFVDTFGWKSVISVDTKETAPIFPATDDTAPELEFPIVELSILLTRIDTLCKKSAFVGAFWQIFFRKCPMGRIKF
jgi:hypothetical protein